MVWNFIYVHYVYAINGVSGSLCCYADSLKPCVLADAISTNSRVQNQMSSVAQQTCMHLLHHLMHVFAYLHISMTYLINSIIASST